MSRRAAISLLAGRLRLTALLERWGARGGLLCINYHRVGHPEECEYDRGVIEARPNDFADQIGLLRRRYRVVAWPEARELIAAPTKLRGLYVLLTFDDGYRDNFQHAFPILQAEGLSALFFLPTAYVGTHRVPWWDQIAYMVRHTNRPQLELSSPRATRWRLDGPKRESSVRSLLAIYKRASHEDAHRFLSDLSAACGIPAPEHVESPLFMNWDEAREMQRGGMYFGSHTQEHHVLARLPVARQAEELLGSKATLERELGVGIDALSYPVGGRESFTSDTIACAKAAGYSAAFSFLEGVNTAEALEPFALRRMSVDLDMGLSRFRLRTALAAGRLAVDW
jgi:peptidoglycan/xylan/chitin deacetylase (PgdA/CDA1 family)